MLKQKYIYDKKEPKEKLVSTSCSFLTLPLMADEPAWGNVKLKLNEMYAFHYISRWKEVCTAN